MERPKQSSVEGSRVKGVLVVEFHFWCQPSFHDFGKGNPICAPRTAECINRFVSVWPEYDMGLANNFAPFNISSIRTQYHTDGISLADRKVIIR